MIRKIDGIDTLLTANNAGGVNVTGTTITVLDSITINPYEIYTGDVVIVKFLAGTAITSGAPTTNYYLYVNETPDLVSATQLATFSTAAGSVGCGVLRHIVANAQDQFVILNPTVSRNFDAGDLSGTNISTITSLNFSSTYYFILAANLTLSKGEVASTTSYEFSVTK
jgi:hypothetical protein